MRYDLSFVKANFPFTQVTDRLQCFSHRFAMPISFARKLAHFIELSDAELNVLQSMPAHVRDVESGADIVAEGAWPSELSLITDGFACRYKLLPKGRRQILAFLIPGDICDLAALLIGKMDYSVAALMHTQ